MSDDETNKETEQGNDSDAIGYGKPPKHSRFKPGKSGNPKGRKKGSKSYRETVRTIVNERIKVKTPSGTKRITKLEALLLGNLNKALKGDAKATDQVLKILRDAGMADEIADTFDAVTMKQLNEEDLLILERCVGSFEPEPETGRDQ